MVREQNLEKNRISCEFKIRGAQICRHELLSIFFHYVPPGNLSLHELFRLYDNFFRWSKSSTTSSIPGREQNKLSAHQGSNVTRSVPDEDIFVRHSPPKISHIGFDPLKTVPRTVFWSAIFSLRSNLSAHQGSNLGPSP